VSQQLSVFTCRFVRIPKQLGREWTTSNERQVLLASFDHISLPGKLDRSLKECSLDNILQESSLDNILQARWTGLSKVTVQSSPSSLDRPLQESSLDRPLQARYTSLSKDTVQASPRKLSRQDYPSSPNKPLQESSLDNILRARWTGLFKLTRQASPSSLDNFRWTGLSRARCSNLSKLVSKLAVQTSPIIPKFVGQASPSSLDNNLQAHQTSLSKKAHQTSLSKKARWTLFSNFVSKLAGQVTKQASSRKLGGQASHISKFAVQASPIIHKLVG
jgi:hypothetical protein